jgi:GT2 family glycosyltransferase/predicted Zn-dependent protease
VPVVALLPDADRQMNAYRHVLPFCDLAFGDAAAAEVLCRDGYGHVVPGTLFGLERAYLEDPPPGDEGRDIDVLFVGSFHPAVQRERLPWLARLARLHPRWNVVLATRVLGDAYRALLRRAKIAFNRSAHGDCNSRALEAPACGALLFQERGNREVAVHFADRQSAVFYGEDDLEALLEHYLTHEDERRAVARAGREQALRCSYAVRWESIQATIDERWPDLEARAKCRARMDGIVALLAQADQVAGDTTGAPTLIQDLDAALQATPTDARLLNARGVAAACTGGVLRSPAAAEAARWFRHALAAEPTNPLIALNLIEALVGIEQHAVAAEGARRALTLLTREATPAANTWDTARFPPGIDFFRVEWERAAWDHAGDRAAELQAKRALLRWRLHALLADLTGDLAHHHEAVLARPDLPNRRAALGRALTLTGRAAESVPHLRCAVQANPFDGTAARHYFHALRAAGDHAGAARFRQEHLLRAEAAPQLLPLQPWMEEPVPTGDELVSLVILCCNAVEFTRRCLERVWQHTRPPYEVILVDNGSTDDTAAYLQEVRRWTGPQRVEILRNPENRGFAAGCNQGLAQAQGRYVVFLNNDTLVTAGWLGGLIAWALFDWPEVGLVGPITNYAAPPQQIAVTYRTLDELDSFVARRRDFAGRVQEFPRLSGFCLLARREVLDRVGPFDERFGIGFFEDDDLGLRVRRAGHKLLIAQDVFVHHFGSRTFAALGIDTDKQLRDNFAQFKDKWGSDAVTPYRPPSGEPALPAPTTPATPATAERTAQTVCLCMIVKNEAHNLPLCLASVADLVDHLVIVDTGSTDATKEIAARYGARVVDFPWVDSFSAARNESLKHAAGDWVFWLDADDRLDEGNRARLRALFISLSSENAAYVMKCRCLPDQQTGAETVVDHVRLFRNDPALRWEFRVHEQILPSLRRQGADVRWSEVVIHHAGYQDAAVRRRKLERDLALLKREHAELGDHPFTLFNLGSVFQELGRHADALLLLRRSLARSRPNDSIVRKLYALLVHCHCAQEQFAEALTACQDGRRVYPDDAELLFAEARLRRRQGDLDGAVACLVQLLEGRPEAHFASVDAGLRGYKARQLLGEVYAQQGRSAEAEGQWRVAVAQRPGFVAAWQSLGQLYLKQQRWPDVEAVAQRLEMAYVSGLDAKVLRGRAALARHEFAAARRSLEEAIDLWPQALEPRVFLSHMLLQEGRDLAAAERALRDVLTLDPQQVEAQRNLAILLRRYPMRL